MKIFGAKTVDIAYAMHEDINAERPTVGRTGSNAWGDCVRPSGSQSLSQESTPVRAGSFKLRITIDKSVLVDGISALARAHNRRPDDIVQAMLADNMSLQEVVGELNFSLPNLEAAVC